MKFKTFLLLFVLLISCKQEVKKDTSNKSVTTKNVQDTVIVKSKNVLNNGYETDNYSKIYTYYWLVNNDTLDLKVTAREYLKDSTLHLSVSHKKPILFKTVLHNIEGYRVLLNRKISSFRERKLSLPFIK